MAEHFKNVAEHYSGHWKRKHRGDHSSKHRKKHHGWDAEEWMLKKDKMMWVLSRLRAEGALSERTIASLVVHLLPKIITKMAADAPKVDEELRKLLPELKPTIKDLHDLVSNTPGLEHCWLALEDSLESESASLGEAVLALLLALESLPYDTKISFVEMFYNTQAKLIHDVF